MPTSATLSKLLMLAASSLGACSVAAGQDFTFCVDYPTTLQGTPYAATQTIDRSSAPASYSLGFDGPAHGLDADVSIDALALLPGGDFLFSTREPFTVGGNTYLSYDIVRFHAGTGLYSAYVAGSSLGLSESADIDALAFDAQGRLLISLASPETVEGTLYEANDILFVSGATLSLAVSGSGIGLPADLNVTGYDRLPSGDLFMFDQPVTLGGTDFTRSDIARYSGGVWATFFHDPSFPTETSGADFSLPCSGTAFSGALSVHRSGGATTALWSAGGSARFDLSRGDLNVLGGDCDHNGAKGDCAGGSFQAALDAILPGADVCMSNDTTGTTFTDGRADPGPARGEFYLVRAVAGCGAGGTWNDGTQIGSRDPGIDAAANECP